ncbi:MAG: ribosomal-protein-alanine N-acetyltransferase [Spongiibacteraceae bacterium]|jgi:[ribosomal protein S18]-alanine N-acetyltransferase|nr:ribosomal-protein-alanine N-acetyltransferase [Spongiibacteraceae bacterium]
MSVERLSHEALDRVLALEAESSPYCWSRADWQSSLKSDDCFELLNEGQTMAVVAFSVVFDEANLLNIAVPVQAQRRGYARQLLQYCLNHYANNGIKHCFLEVRRSNAAAIALYEKLGFSVIGERKNYYPVTGGREDALVYICRLQQGESEDA